MSVSSLLHLGIRSHVKSAAGENSTQRVRLSPRPLRKGLVVAVANNPKVVELQLTLCPARMDPAVGLV